MEHLSPIVKFSWGDLDLAAIIMILVTSIVAFVLARLAVRNLSVENPGKLQNFMEWVVEFVSNIIGTATDFKRGRVYLSLGLALILYIFIGNMLGLPFNFITEAHGHATFLGMDLYMNGQEEAEFAWWKSPTADASMTMALALTVIVLSHIQGFRHNRKHYLKHYFEPWPFFLPINLIETVAKPLTLGLRLFGNIYAGEVMISVILGMGWVGIPALLVWQGFSIFVGAIQAFVFTMLTMVYIGQASIHEEGH
ncbi:F0F1 ATP synthase subunit A [Cohnella lubricantis]|uniref:ATP synthase subunit a n=1 Tax=Cohnella lubricantis TaxID=2163172 RepID=A0A841TC00_9BACL|nr:F0F1 ATP synthase subunit A [Cohnella lubricantis]MBB6676760.1 F0F1 ATP synthase subunit A [Cohnella lubricantis]MBP2117806.1 F-type H+-transporting ATPase subunit a [Cohnella lubricantis]